MLPIGDELPSLSVLLENRKGRLVRPGDVDDTLAFKFSGETAWSGTMTSCSDAEGLGVYRGGGYLQLDKESYTRFTLLLVGLH